MKTVWHMTVSPILNKIDSCEYPDGVSPDKSGYLNPDTAKLYYESFGAGDALVLIHAGIMDSRMWNFQVPDLSVHFRVIRYDMRGFGKSSMPDSAYDPNLDLLLLLDSCKADKATLVGISLGALQAIDFTINYPDRVNSLIISGPGFPDWPLSPATRKKHIEFNRIVQEQGADSAVQSMLTDPFWRRGAPGAEYPEALALYEKILTDNKKSFTVNWQLRKITPGLKERLVEIKCPALLFRPEKEMLSLISVGDTLKEKIEGISILEVRNASHLLNMEKPDEFNKAVLAFLKPGLT
jgi:pimeloyl-ACP methyl ester carboxylesterase